MVNSFSSIELAVVAITNFILVIEYSWISGWIIGRSFLKKTSWWWGVVAFMIALTAFLGGINHGFFEIGHVKIYGFMWLITYLSIGLTSLSIWHSGCEYFMPNTLPKKILNGIFWGIFIVYIFFSFIADASNIKSFISTNFYSFAVLDYLLSLLGLIGLNTFYWQKKGSVHIFVFFIVILISSIIQQTRLSLFNGLLNHNALYHIISMLSGIPFLYINRNMTYAKL